jgi:rare lipoprotein A
MSCGTRLCALLAVSLVGCATTATTTAPPPSTIREVPHARAFSFEGNATFYGKHENGGPTASGERFDMYKLTAAHRTLPMQTHVRCTNLRNGRAVTVRINDRGPYGKGRVIDLSWAAAKQLDMLDAGVVPVRCEVVR